MNGFYLLVLICSRASGGLNSDGEWSWMEERMKEDEKRRYKGESKKTRKAKEDEKTERWENLREEGDRR